MYTICIKKPKVLNGGVRERTEEAEGVSKPIGRALSTNQNPQSSQGQNNTNQRVQMEGAMLLPHMYRGVESGWGSTLIEACGGQMDDGGSSGGKKERWITFKM